MEAQQVPKHRPRSRPERRPGDFWTISVGPPCLGSRDGAEAMVRSTYTVEGSRAPAARPATKGEKVLSCWPGGACDVAADHPPRDPTSPPYGPSPATKELGSLCPVRPRSRQTSMPGRGASCFTPPERAGSRSDMTVTPDSWTSTCGSSPSRVGLVRRTRWKERAGALLRAHWVSTYRTRRRRTAPAGVFRQRGLPFASR